MPVTFAVDDVAPAAEPPRTRPLSVVVGDVLALGAEASMPVIDGPLTHPLLGAVHVAFSEHRPLVLSPDAVWLTIAQGLARHVRLNADSLRGRLTRHEGKQRLEVEHRGPFPEDASGIAELVARMRGTLARELGEQAAALFRCDFTTSTEVERTASELVLLDACSPFYDFAISCVCGIPAITLSGEPDDWRSIRARIDAVAELVAGSSIEAWAPALRAITDQLVLAAEGRADRAFFQRIYKPRKAYGWDRVTGWIAWLYPYLGQNGRHEAPSLLLQHAPDRPLPGEDRVRASDAVGPDWWTGPGIGLQDVPAELSQCLFRVTDHVRGGTRFHVTLRGGLAAISVDERGAIVPRAAWWCERGEPSIDELADAITRDHVFTAPGGPPPPGQAEVTALRERFGSFSLHGGAVRFLPEPWHLELDRHAFGTVFVELGDGSALAAVPASRAASRSGTAWVTIPADAVTRQPSPPGVITSRRCARPLAELPVVATSLTRYLAAALAEGGIPTLPSLGSLFRFVEPWQQLPSLPYVPPQPQLAPESEVPLASRTTLQLGGAARRLAHIRGEQDVAPALAWAESEGLPVFVLGGGSNLIVPDEGFPGLVLAMESRGLATLRSENTRGEACMRVTAAAGEPWDELVAFTVLHGWQGLECLSGIPGLVGATPVQNVGAYGQEVADTIVAVGVVDRRTKLARRLTAEECRFAYRDSALKREPDRYVVTWVTFELRIGAPPALEYAELQKALAHREAPTLQETRDTVLALRKKKSMVLDAFDPNRRSAGSFFTNPIVSGEVAAHVVERAIARGVVKDATEVPRWPEADGRVKLAAGWLIEKAGIHRGLRLGNVGVSSAHALALVHHGDGTAKELLALAEHVRGAVREAFGVVLEREPVLMAPPGA